MGKDRWVGRELRRKGSETSTALELYQSEASLGNSACSQIWTVYTTPVAARRSLSVFRKRIHDGDLRVPVHTLAVGHILPLVVTRLILDVGQVGVGGGTSKLVWNEQCGWMVGSGEQERPTVHGLIGRFK